MRNLSPSDHAEFAQHIGVSDRTINSAENDKRAVRRITLNAWAHATGVSLEWLETGVAAGGPTPPPGDGLPDTAAMRRLTESKLRRGAPTRQYALALARAA